MLVITRKKGESVLIGDDIEITIIKAEDGNVKISISAPRDIIILRKELIREVKEENMEAVSKDISVLKNLK